MGDMMGAMTVWHLVWLVIALLVVAGAVVGAVSLARSAGRPARTERPSPAEILERRYAAGEIDEDEYLRRLSGISKD